MATALTSKQKRDIAVMYMNDYTIYEIATYFGISNRQIREYLNDEGYLIGNSSSQESKFQWLLKNWRWKKPVIKHRTISDSGHRIVRKGEKMHLRTPYHPNGVWN